MAAYAETVVTDTSSDPPDGAGDFGGWANAIKVSDEGTDPLQLGQALAQKAIAQGADEILALSK